MPVNLRYDLLPCEVEAFELLAGQKIKHPEVIRVDHESILFTVDEKPFTAWKTTGTKTATILRVDPGFVADY